MDLARQKVANEAVDRFVKSGMLLGLGTGRTAVLAIKRIGEKLRNGELECIKGIPTSVETAELAFDCNIELINLEDNSNIDVAIDGADEVDCDLNLIKGRGGALLREKMIEQNAKTFVVIVDEAKLAYNGLGSLGVLPVEVCKFSCKHIMKQLLELPSLKGKCTAELRLDPKDGSIYETANENYIVDISFTSKCLGDPIAMSKEIINIVGVVEHGLFTGMTRNVLVGMKDGKVEDALALFKAS